MANYRGVVDVSQWVVGGNNKLHKLIKERWKQLSNVKRPAAVSTVTNRVCEVPFSFFSSFLSFLSFFCAFETEWRWFREDAAIPLLCMSWIQIADERCSTAPSMTPDQTAVEFVNFSCKWRWFSKICSVSTNLKECHYKCDDSDEMEAILEPCFHLLVAALLREHGNLLWNLSPAACSDKINYRNDVNGSL